MLTTLLLANLPDPPAAGEITVVAVDVLIKEIGWYNDKANEDGWYNDKAEEDGWL